MRFFHDIIDMKCPRKDKIFLYPDPSRKIDWDLNLPEPNVTELTRHSTAVICHMNETLSSLGSAGKNII